MVGTASSDPHRREICDEVKVGRVALLADGGTDIDLALDHAPGQRRAQFVSAQARTWFGVVLVLLGRRDHLICIETEGREFLPGQIKAQLCLGIGRSRREKRGFCRDPFVPKGLLAIVVGFLQLSVDRGSQVLTLGVGYLPTVEDGRRPRPSSRDHRGA